MTTWIPIEKLTAPIDRLLEDSVARLLEDGEDRNLQEIDVYPIWVNQPKS